MPSVAAGLKLFKPMLVEAVCLKGITKNSCII